MSFKPFPGQTESRPKKPKSRFNGLQDMTGIDKVPTVIPEDERIARKVAKTKEIVAAMEFEKAIPKCEDCVWYSMTHSRDQKQWNECVQPMVINWRVEGRSTVHNSVLAKNARDNEELCGHNGDLFTAKTWWEANGANVKRLAITWAIIASILTTIGVCTIYFGWDHVWPVIVGIVGIGFLLLLLSVS